MKVQTDHRWNCLAFLMLHFGFFLLPAFLTRAVAENWKDQQSPTPSGSRNREIETLLLDGLTPDGYHPNGSKTSREEDSRETTFPLNALRKTGLRLQGIQL
jgi:hypothetical protein